MTDQPQVSLRERVANYVEAAYLHGLPTENLDTGESEPPRDISDVAWITDSLLTAFEATAKGVIGETEGYSWEHATPNNDEWLKMKRNDLRAEQLARLAALLRGEGE